MTVQFLMMFTAERHGKFVADLASKSSGLGKFEMVGIARASAGRSRQGCAATKIRWALLRAMTGLRNGVTN